MIILITDDLDVRHNIVEEVLGKAGHTILHAFDYYECLEILSSYQKTIGLLMLDHDLNCYSTSDKDGKQIEKTGKDIVRFIGSNLPRAKYPTLAIVHSLSPEAKYMVEDLQRLDIYTQHRPFSEKMVLALMKELIEQ